MKDSVSTIVLDERGWRDLLDQMQVGIFVLVDEHVQWANRALLAMLDYTMDEISSKPAWHIVHPEEQERVKAIALERVAGMRMDEVYETRLVKRDGDVLWTEIRAVPIVFKKIPAILTNVVDITQRKQVEQSLAQSEEQLRGFLQSAPVGIYRMSIDGRVLIANPSMLRMLGHDELSDPVAMGLQRQSFDPTFPDCEFKIRIERDQEVMGIESAWIREDDSLIYIRESARIVQDKSGNKFYDGMVEDITRQKLSSQTLALYAGRLEARRELDREILQAQSSVDIARALVRRIRKLVPCMRASVVSVDMDSGTARVLAEMTSVDVHETLKEGFECAMEQLLPAQLLYNPHELYYEPDLAKKEQVPNSAEPLLSVGINSYLVAPLLSQGRLIGTLNLASEHARAFDSEQQSIVTGLASQLAIAMEQTALRERLGRERQLLKTLIDGLAEGVFLASSNLRLVLANPVALKYLHVIEGKSAVMKMDLRNSVVGEKIMDGDFELVTDTEPPRVFEIVSRRVSSDFSSVGLQEKAGGWAVIIRDVTDDRQRQMLLGRRERRAAIGSLAEGVAHDFNNLISAISGSAWIILRKLPEGDSLRSTAEDIRDTCERATHLSRQLVKFSRASSEGKKVLNLNSVVDGMGKMLNRLVGSPIQVSVDLATDLVPVFADPVGLEQILVNLVINARDAMRMGGRLHISTRMYEVVQGDESWMEETQEGQYVMLAVEDSGDGMDEKTMARMFEPFFTTKLDDGGSGLGLSNVKAIVSRDKGRIRVSSSPGKGTKIEIIYPIYSS